MKTPREILLQRHRDAQSKLDAIRRAAIAETRSEPARTPIKLRDVLRSLRWHLVGMSAIWLLVLVLRADTGQAPQMMASIPSTKIPPPQVMLASMREHRRVLVEMTDSHPPDGERHELLLPKPRSELRSEFSIA
jgi:hypothetical protein